MHELDEKAPSLICKAKKNSADYSRKMTKSSFKQAHEFEKRRAESHSGIQPSVPLMISHTLSLISEQYEAAQALCALNQWQSSRGTVYILEFMIQLETTMTYQRVLDIHTKQQLILEVSITASLASRWY
ncbi:uncharacterized protein [Pyrus communis]|uniref:uncharacterized protein isoform X2 n=1 Tax=Pyrus communis TaxID=23211 RepID=UPI0035BEDB99